MYSLQIKELIDQLIESSDTDVSNLGHKLINLNELHTSGQLSTVEYLEILCDLSQLVNINDQMQEVKNWNEISKAIDTIEKIRNWLPMI